jgi:hypothetical protein
MHKFILKVILMSIILQIIFKNLDLKIFSVKY